MLRRLFGPLFIVAGVLHFAFPRWYEAIMPDYLPARRELVYVSGIAEIVSGAALLHPRTRRAGGGLAIATLLAVFPANVHMALHPERYDVPAAALWARLPLQALLVAWAWAAARD